MASSSNLGLNKIGRVKALSEPAVDRGKRRYRVCYFALFPPEASEADGCAQFPKSRGLFTGTGEGSRVAGLD